MDEEKLEADLAEAIGKATACMCLNAALVATMVTRGILPKEDAATLSADATAALLAMSGLSDDVKLIGQSALRGFSRSWTKLVTKN